MIGYLSSLSAGILTLWCYIIWYLVMIVFYFDKNIALWGNSLGLSIIVGLALVLATGALSLERIRNNFWQVSRLFICPFCVSSFSALTKEKNFSLIISPIFEQNIIALGFCLLFAFMVLIIKKSSPLKVS